MFSERNVTIELPLGYSDRRLAKLLDVPLTFVRKEIKAGRLRRTTLGPGQTVILYSDVSDYLRRCSSEAGGA